MNNTYPLSRLYIPVLLTWQRCASSFAVILRVVPTQQAFPYVSYTCLVPMPVRSPSRGTLSLQCLNKIPYIPVWHILKIYNRLDFMSIISCCNTMTE